MLHGLLSNFISIIKNFIFKFSLNFLFIILIVYSFSSSHSASISTLNNLSSLSSFNQFELMSNSSYRNFILRQYFIDLLNISHSSLVRSMIYSYHLTSKSTQIKNTKRKREIDDTLSSSSFRPIFTLQSSNCLIINNQVQSTFIWSHSIEFLVSIELIYHIDSIETKKSSIPLHIKFKQSETLVEFFTINTYLKFDSNRDFYFINIFEYILQITNQSLIIESIINYETCQTSHTYMIISSTNIRLKPNHTMKLNPTLSFDLRQLVQTETDSSLSICKLKTLQIKFEELGLAYLIIRPKEYTFTYCDGSCSYSTLQQQQQSSMHALFQSIVNRKHPNIPQPTCVPSQFADDNFLLRQMDGSIEIYPIKDVIVKQCACL